MGNKTKNIRNGRNHGFTLLEILVVIAIISVLSTIVITILNPVMRITSAYDTQRTSDVNAINNGVQQYFIDHNNYDALGLKNLETEICDTGIESSADTGRCVGLINLSPLVPRYLAAIPTDPLVLLEKNRKSDDKTAVNATEDLQENLEENLSGNGYTILHISGSQIAVNAPNKLEATGQNIVIASFDLIDAKTRILLIAILIIVCVTVATYLILKNYSRGNF